MPDTTATATDLFLDCSATARAGDTHPKLVAKLAAEGRIRTRQFPGGRKTYSVADLQALVAGGPPEGQGVTPPAAPSLRHRRRARRSPGSA
jgi:hypothetical protein